MAFKGIRDVLESNIEQEEVDILISYYTSLGVCTECGCDAIAQGFVTDDYEAEYQISGLCQSCQDKLFGR